MNEQIKQVESKTIHWQCSGCDHLCALLVDTVVVPANLTHLARCGGDQRWRKV
jgi:hypothetical protein